MKRKATGTGNKPINDVGNKGLHDQYDVQLEESEDGSFRARVTDQLHIDKVLLKSQITVAQHKAAEYLLQIFVDAGVFVKTVDHTSALSGMTGGKPPSMFTSGLMKLRDVSLCVEEAVGEDDAFKVCVTVAKDYPIHDEDLDVFRKAFNAIDQAYLT
jgi:hypothetical protein|tara:strand:- start:1221 stop:1691 length:471 start_codon:yes stop_codon:yes gene_type:complete